MSKNKIRKTKGIIFVFIFGVVIGILVAGRPKDSVAEEVKVNASTNSIDQNKSKTEKSKEKNSIPEELYDDCYKGLTADNPATNKLEYKETLLYLILNGVESPVSLYVKGLDKDDIKNTSLYSDYTYFRLTGYKLYDGKDDTKRAKVSFEYKENYYAYMNIVKGKAIPKGEDRAVEIAKVVKSFMKKYIDDSMSDYEKEKVIYAYLAKNVSYLHDDSNSNGDHHMAYGALVNHKAVCNGYSHAFDLMARCCNVECDYVLGEANGNGHAWNMVRLDDKWYNVDVTWGDTSADNVEFLDYTYSYLNLTDEELAETGHVWDRTAYHVADSLDYNEMYLNNKLCTYDEFGQLISQNMYAGNILECAVTDFDPEKYDITGTVRDQGYHGAFKWYYGSSPKGYNWISIYFY